MKTAAATPPAASSGAITSRQNPRVQALARLRERAGREENRLFLVEGFRELSRALDANAQVIEVYFCPELFKTTGSAAASGSNASTAANATTAAALVARAAAHGANPVELGASAFEKVSGREGADGLLGVARLPDTSLAALAPRVDAAPTPLLLVVEAVEKPGNLGALFRTADSAGCTALICCDPVADPFNPNAVRASQGALFSMPCAVAGPEAVAAFLAARKIAVFAATPAAQKRYWDADFCRPAALLLGSEKDGLSPFWLEAAGQTAPTAASFAPAATSFAPTTASLAPAATSLAPTAASLAPAAASLAPTAGRAASASSVFPALEPIAIPQAGLSDSLNVGVAGAVCLFEAVRQRALANP